MDDNLKQQILSTRRMAADGTTVVYDLTSNVEFTHPRKTAEALAEVFFETDAAHWFIIVDDQVLFKPRYRARIIVSDENNRKVHATLKDFFNDMKKDELKNKFADQIENAATYQTGLGAIFFAGFLGAALIQSSERQGQKDAYVEKLLKDITMNTEIQTVGAFS